MKPILTVFADSPDGGQGVARDMRVRWALEEVGQDYDVRTVPFAKLKESEHRARHPFGKIPTYEEGELTLFESGAIALHLAESRPGLLPGDAEARERAIVWLFAALNTVEPPIIEREGYLIMEKDKPYFRDRLTLLDDRVRERLAEVSAFLGERDWLEGEFTVGDLMMIEVLIRLKDPTLPGTSLLEEFPTLARYVERGEARPAFKRAFDGQRQVFLESQEA
ncbi:glutathione S-transferase family protein [Sphingomonas lutea]|uniref:Glutathione S-transferase family protein n=1 Tax=Sphingomonas lutea TaxID=1045317 RepID=A0A7G9SJW6_9SPHN|nr:glutathione S-transferase family protein [Sphingomonas lutea]QNN68141.1 glutathione S-transferase family protein [Sphingomonas lutea]